jgi:hypothetical protein
VTANPSPIIHDAENEVKPVVGRVEGDEVRAAVLIDQQPVEPEHQIDDAPADQVDARGHGRAGEREPDEPERDVHDVVKPADLEDVEQLRLRVVSGEVEAAVQVRGDSGDEAEDSDENERRPDQRGQ